MRAPRTYDDFAVAFEPAIGGGFEVRILRSPRGGGKGHFNVPELTSNPERLLFSLDAEAGRSARSPGVDEATPLPKAREIGEALFEALFQGKLRDLFLECLAEIREDTGLRLRLQFDLVEYPELCPVAALPWELLRRPDTGKELSLDPRTPVVRFLEIDHPRDPLRVKSPLRVLVVIACPDDQTPLALARERKELEKRWSGPGWEVVVLEPATLKALRSTLRNETFHVVHFMGHGEIDPATGEGTLLFERGDNGSHPVGGRLLDVNLAGVHSLRLVVLNACQSGTEGCGAFTGVASALVQGGQTAVVAMQAPVSDDAAIDFATELYEVLAEGAVLESAVTEGRIAVKGLRPETAEWANPVLFLRRSDGRLFEIGTTDIEEPAPEDEVNELGIRTFRHPIHRLENEVGEENLLDLLPFFDGRYLRPEHSWQGSVYPEVREFLLGRAEGKQSLVLRMDAHLSLTFAAGYCFGGKAGTGVVFRQRTPLGLADWRPGLGPSAEEKLWRDAPDRDDLDSDGHDVALAISVTRDVLGDVELYVEDNLPGVRRIVVATLHPRPNNTGVRDGAMAWDLAGSVADLLAERDAEERKSTLHIFAAAPNGFMFFLGQLAHGFGRTVVYEYDFDTRAPGAYSPAFTFPPEEFPDRQAEPALRRRSE